MSNMFQAVAQSVKHWYVPLIIGIMLIVIGGYIFSAPLETYLTLTVLFSVSFIAFGILEIVFSLQNSKTLSNWGWYLIGGLISLLAGIYLIIHPGISVEILPTFVALTLLFRCSLYLGISFDLRRLGILSWGNVAIASILGMILSFMLLANPLFAGLSLVTLTALSFIFSGSTSVVLAFRLKKAKELFGQKK